MALESHTDIGLCENTALESDTVSEHWHEKTQRSRESVGQGQEKSPCGDDLWGLGPDGEESCWTRRRNGCILRTPALASRCMVLFFKVSGQ